ncbi:DUF6264 family protein [Leifsonia aquatica]|uniref:DUF6264 family protein n=1 Tax=Leifsonia aquatica TaxID=144185 RepID=UPI000468C3EF|nr:DUF6264 family protein [Leifsonia aquatica]
MADEHPQPDERPRPKYGELAPPGWEWKPPADVDRLDTARPNPVDDETAPAPDAAPGSYRPVPPPAAHPPAGAAADRGPAPRWNTTLTILLVAFGLFGVSYSVGTLQALPTYMQLLHTTQGLGDYTPAPAIQTIITAGTVTMTGIWAISTGLAVWRLLRRRMSFWIPLTAGVVAFVVLIVFVAVALSTDPALIDFYSGLSTVSPVPTAPATP